MNASHLGADVHDSVSKMITVNHVKQMDRITLVIINVYNETGLPTIH